MTLAFEESKEVHVAVLKWDVEADPVEKGREEEKGRGRMGRRDQGTWMLTEGREASGEG